MPALSSFAQLETTIGVVALMIFLTILVIAIVLFIAAQVTEEHIDNTAPREDIHHHYSA